MSLDIFTKLYLLTITVYFCDSNIHSVVNVCNMSAEIAGETKFIYPSAVPIGGLQAGKHMKYHNISLLDCISHCCNNTDCSLSLYHIKSCYTFECQINNFTQCMPEIHDDKKFKKFTLLYLRFPKGVLKSGMTLQALNSTKDNIKTTTQQTKGKVPDALVPNILDIDVGTNKTIFLPNNSVTLTAEVINGTGSKYEYEWDLVSKPASKTVGTLEGKTKKDLLLKDLVLGEYQFKVTVRGNNSYGEALVFVIVKPALKKNERPVAIIKPKFQVVQLPNNIILDGSGSTDDVKIVSYHWETVKAPIDIEKDIKDNQPMLQLDKNIIAGNYTFKLTVKDAEGQSNFTTAKLVVLPEKDYPPKSDPGPNIIVNLPVNTVILNGSGSTDDKKISSYEWSKTSDSPTADMQGVRKPILKLNNLQEGTYTFNLKVTDSSGQTSDKEVKVFVKPRVNMAPTAKASVKSDNIVRVALPATQAILNGSLSSDDDKIVKYKWEQEAGQPLLSIVHGDSAIAYVTDLKVGVFQFKLTVWDNDKLSNSDIVTLRVDENQNQSPKAIILPNENINYLMPNLIRINGSKSWDDHKIVRYHWSRMDECLAVGDVLDNSDKESVLLLTGLLPGNYRFRLTVYDEEGLSDSSETTFLVLPSKMEIYYVELQFLCAITSFTQAKKRDFRSNLQLIIQKKIDSDSSKVKINIVKIESVPFMNSVSIIFYATSHQKSMSSYAVSTKTPVAMKSQQLKVVSESKNQNEKPVTSVAYISALDVIGALNEVRRDSLTLTYPLLKIETFVCQNNCSNHGKCNPVTRFCECDTFWTSNFIRIRYGDGRPNCDWSIIYLVIISFAIILTLIAIIWMIFWIHRKKCKNKKAGKIRKHKYMRLSEYDPTSKLEVSTKFPKSLTNGVKARSIQDKELNGFIDSDSSISSDDKETLFISSRNPNSSTSHAASLSNGQATKNM